MAKKPDGSTTVTGLRKQAEELLGTTRRDVAAMPVKEVQQLVHELQVHQIELEMQNEELRRTQEELEAARDRYVDLYDFAPAGHLMLDTHGTIVEANLRAGTLLGINRKDLIGQPLARFIARSDEDTFHRHCQEVMKSGTRQTCEVQLGNKAGASRWGYLESLAIFDDEGRITQWRTALLDISARKQMEMELESNKIQLEGIIESAMDAIITVDEGERVVVFNRAAESMFLCQSADAMGQPFDRFIPERFRQAHHGHMSIFARTQATSRSMGRPGGLLGLRTNGEEFPFEASVSHVRIAGQPLFTVILRDITERNRAEEKLRQSELRLQAILDNSPGMVILKDTEGRYLHVNRQFERAFHMTREQVVGKTDEAIFVPEQAAAFRANDLKVHQAGVPLEFEEVAMHDDGPHTSIVSKFLLYDGDGKPYALCGITTDITWRKIAEEALRSSDAFTRSVLNSLSAHVCVLDKDGFILKTNDAWREFARCNLSRTMIGSDVGANYLDVCRRAIADGESTAQVILGGIEDVLGGSQPSFSAEYPCHSPEEECWFLMRVTPLKESQGVVISHTDISERIQMARKLEQHILLLHGKQVELESLAKKLIEARQEREETSPLSPAGDALDYPLIVST